MCPCLKGDCLQFVQAVNHSLLLTFIPLSRLCRFCCQLLVYCNWWMLEKTAVTSFSPSCIPRTALASAPLPTCTPAPSCCSRPMPMQVRGGQGRGSGCATPAPRYSSSWAQHVLAALFRLLLLEQEGNALLGSRLATFCDAASCEMWFGRRGAP